MGQVDKAGLLVKIQSLCFRLEQVQDCEESRRPPGSVDEAKERLRFLMHRRYPRCAFPARSVRRRAPYRLQASAGVNGWGVDGPLRITSALNSAAAVKGFAIRIFI